MPQEENVPHCICRNLNCQIASGFCHCGCGNKTTVYYGKIRQYIHGHNGSRLPFKPFTLEEGECICRDRNCTIPYGLCHCGCEMTAPIANRNRRDVDFIAGKPVRFCNGHNNSSATKPRVFLPDGMCVCRNPQCDIAFGECHCGCGGKVPTATRSQTTKGWVKGIPRVFIHGHKFRLSPVDYIEEDRGYKTTCWIWQLSRNTHGYGSMTRRPSEKSGLAHIILYERRYGTVPDGLELDHLCRVRCCVNPDHLEPVPRRVNVQRGAQAKLTPRDVLQIRDLFKCMKCEDIAELYNVSPTCVSDVAYRKSWTNI
jgi:HNH endonuclease